MFTYSWFACPQLRIMLFNKTGCQVTLLKGMGDCSFSEVQCRCSDGEHMGKPVISPQRQWQESSSWPEDIEQSLRQYRKFLSQLNVKVNAKACTKQMKFLMTLLLLVTLRLCYLKIYLGLYFYKPSFGGLKAFGWELTRRKQLSGYSKVLASSMPLLENCRLHHSECFISVWLHVKQGFHPFLKKTS